MDPASHSRKARLRAFCPLVTLSKGPALLKKKKVLALIRCTFLENFLCLNACSSATRSEPAQAGGSTDAGHARGAAGSGHQLAPIPGSRVAALGDHLPEGPLPDHDGHEREAAVHPHLR